jgi:hypothetical protein
MSRWFRFYEEVLDDPKAQKLPLVLFKAWVNILCLASKNNGKIPVEDVSFALRVTEKAAEDILSDLGAAGLIDEFEGTYSPHNWGKRQYKSDVSDPTAAERMRRHRNAHRNATVTVTVPRAETETETEKKEDRPKRVRTLCSDDFEEFWKRYPKTPNMSKSEAWKAWQRLPDEDRIAATAAVPKYIAFLRSKTDHPTVHACRFLSQRRFDGFNEPEPDNVVPIGFYAEFGSAELDAWDAHNRKTNGATLPRDKRGGWLVPARYPPGYEPQAATA